MVVISQGETQMARKIKKYGWKPSLPHDHKKYSDCFPMNAEMPSKVDLRPKCPPVYDQGELGSCTANGISGCIQFIQPAFMPSRLFIYYNERAMEGDIDTDGGAQIHDGIKSVGTIGVCEETEWPYNIAKFKDKPSFQSFLNAKKDVLNDYFSITAAQEIKQCLTTGYPVVFGMTAYESFESPEVAKTGLLPMPKHNEQIVGGHCMAIVGYNESKKIFIVRNSWGDSWALAGYCEIPYAYIEKYASDMWTIR